MIFIYYNATEIKYERILLLDTEALLTECHLDIKTIPKGIYCYELGGKEEDKEYPFTLQKKVDTNYCGTVLFKKPIAELKELKSICVEDRIFYIVEGITLETFLNDDFF